MWWALVLISAESWYVSLMLLIIHVSRNRLLCVEPFAARNVFPESFPHSPFPSVPPPFPPPLPPPFSLPFFPPIVSFFFHYFPPRGMIPRSAPCETAAGNFWVRPEFMRKWNFGKVGILERKLFFWPRASESGDFRKFERMFWLQLIFGCVDFHEISLFCVLCYEICDILTKLPFHYFRLMLRVLDQLLKLARLWFWRTNKFLVRIKRAGRAMWAILTLTVKIAQFWR